MHEEPVALFDLNDVRLDALESRQGLKDESIEKIGSYLEGASLQVDDRVHDPQVEGLVEDAGHLSVEGIEMALPDVLHRVVKVSLSNQCIEAAPFLLSLRNEALELSLTRRPFVCMKLLVGRAAERLLHLAQ